MNRPPDRWRGKLPIPEHTHPCVRGLFMLLNQQKTTITECADRGGFRRGTMSDWRYRRMARVDHLDAALNVLGYELCIRPKAENKKSREETASVGAAS